VVLNYKRAEMPEEEIMLKRYTGNAMGDLWIALAKFTGWTKVEIASIEARIEQGEIQAVVPEGIIKTIKIDPDEIDSIEGKTKHDVISYLMHVSPQLPTDLRPWFHHRMTSMDPQETALFMALVASLELLIADVDKLLAVIKQRSFEFKDTPMIGRTHGIHAEPITFGVKLAKWHDELQRHRSRLIEVRHCIAVGKLSGAVGMYTLDPKVEARVCEKLGLRPVLSTQIVPRDFITEYLGVLANIGGSLGCFATTLRGLTRTEIREVMEFFDFEQRGSSAMPHKKNPIGLENVVSLSRLLGGYWTVAFQNQITWDERDLTNSANERVILPDASIVLDYALNRFTGILDKLIVFPEQMMHNINMMKGLIYSQDVQALVAEKSGLPREEAYGLVREVVMRCWKSNFELDFFIALAADDQIVQYVNRDELAQCFNLAEKLKFVDFIFERAYGQVTENKL